MGWETEDESTTFVQYTSVSDMRDMEYLKFNEESK